LKAARQALFDMRATEAIGDDAFHRVEQELDWLEMADGSDRQ
jgi:CPA1 family monovalent cation:H+ antiporter